MHHRAELCPIEVQNAANTALDHAVEVAADTNVKQQVVHNATVRKSNAIYLGVTGECYGHDGD